MNRFFSFGILFLLIGFVWFGCSDDTVSPSTTTTSTTSATTTGGSSTSATSTTATTTGGATTSTTSSGSTTSTSSGTTTSGSTGAGTTSGGNYSPSFELTWKDTLIKATSFLADYGEKIYVSGLDKNSNLVVDFAFPAKKGQLILDKPFSFEDQLDHTKGIFYIGSDQWAIVNGVANITKHSNNRIEGNFSGKAYLFDYASGSPVAIDSAFVKNGKFKDIYVKG